MIFQKSLSTINFITLVITLSHFYKVTTAYDLTKVDQIFLNQPNIIFMFLKTCTIIIQNCTSTFSSVPSKWHFLMLLSFNYRRCLRRNLSVVLSRNNVRNNIVINYYICNTSSFVNKLKRFHLKINVVLEIFWDFYN